MASAGHDHKELRHARRDMIVDGFDGLNVSVKFPVYEVKALRAFLQTVDNYYPALQEASHAMKLDGHPFEPGDVQAVVRQFIVNLRKLSTVVNEKPEREDGLESVEAKPN